MLDQNDTSYYNLSGALVYDVSVMCSLYVVRVLLTSCLAMHRRFRLYTRGSSCCPVRSGEPGNAEYEPELYRRNHFLASVLRLR